MSTHKERRINFFREWQAPCQPQSHGLSFPIEIDFIDHVRRSGGQVFYPYHFSVNDESEYHKTLSYLIDALEFLPCRVDFAFDCTWRALEVTLNRGYLTSGPNPNTKPKIADVLEWCIGAIFDSAVYTNLVTVSIFDRLFTVIPRQACEYLGKRIVKKYNPSKTIEEQPGTIKRLGRRSIQNESLLLAIATKYGTEQTPGTSVHMLGGFLIRYLRGDALTIDSVTYQITHAERVAMLIDGLLYTYRCDRVHGDIVSPFKSSKATLQTYALAHFAFIAAHALFSACTENA